MSLVGWSIRGLKPEKFHSCGCYPPTHHPEHKKITDLKTNQQNYYFKFPPPCKYYPQHRPTMREIGAKNK